MTVESRFKNSSFHRDGKPPQAKSKPTPTPTQKPKPKPKPQTISEAAEANITEPNSEFIKELVETGKANWSKAPKAVKQRYNGIFLILFSIPIIAFSTFEMIRRLEGTSTKKVRQGEILDNQDIRKYDEVEKWQVEKNSIMYKLFGRDFFLDGFTSKTMRDDKGKPQENPKKD